MLRCQSYGEAAKSRRLSKRPLLVRACDFTGQAIYAFCLEDEPWSEQHGRDIDLELNAELSMANCYVLKDWRTEAATRGDPFSELQAQVGSPSAGLRSDGGGNGATRMQCFEYDEGESPGERFPAHLQFWSVILRELFSYEGNMIEQPAATIRVCIYLSTRECFCFLTP